jgi:membrane associated rhomboid family serine protease
VTRCPDHPRELVETSEGRQCPHCKGLLSTTSQVVDIAGPADELLEPETRLDSIPFKKPRACPECATTMTPLRIARLEAWIEKCPACELHWVEASDLRSLGLVKKSLARQDAWSSMDATERKELAADLAEAEVPKSEFVEELTMGEAVRAAIGVPVLSGLSGAQRPVLTWVSIAALALCFLGGLLAPDTLGVDALGYLPSRDTAFKAIAATFAHDGWLHLGGNLLFAWLFGDAVERRVPHLVIPGALVGMGAMALVIDGATDGTTVIVGASGGVYALMGLCAVLQRQGKWLVPLFSILRATGFLRQTSGRLLALRVPLPFAMGAYALIDVLQGADAGSGIAWVAHAAGFLLGLLGGLVLERTQAD